MKRSPLPLAVVLSVLACATVVGCAAPRVPPPPSAAVAAAPSLPPLRIAGDGRSLVRHDGVPFFYLADTAWELLHRADRAQVDLYLRNRAAKGFTAVHFVVLPEVNGLESPNRQGDLPLHDLDTRRPNERYFQHLDFVVDSAAAHGLYVGLLPTWGSYAVKEKHPLFPDHLLFDAPRAADWGRFLAGRYGRRTNVVWILGGDRNPAGYEETWRAMARGLADGARAAGGGEPLVTYHGQTGGAVGDTLGAEPWLSFRMLQTGHSITAAPHELVTVEWERQPPRPVIVGEPGYERHPDKGGTGGKLGDADVRRQAYWSAFAGAFGHTYGANEIWMMWSPEIEPVSVRAKVKPPFLGAERPWWQALDYPGATQMGHLRALIESRPTVGRVPDQSLVVDAGTGLDHIRATRGGAGEYAFVYVPGAGRTVELNLAPLGGRRLVGWWFDPRTGSARPLGEALGPEPQVRVTTPAEGVDWVLAIDDAARGFGAPGVRPAR